VKRREITGVSRPKRMSLWKKLFGILTIACLTFMLWFGAVTQMNVEDSALFNTIAIIFDVVLLISGVAYSIDTLKRKQWLFFGIFAVVLGLFALYYILFISIKWMVPHWMLWTYDVIILESYLVYLTAHWEKPAST
jgi:hypothetical protein